MLTTKNYINNNTQFISLFLGFFASSVLYIFIHPFYPQITAIFALLSFSFLFSNVYMLISTKQSIHVVFFPIIALTWMYFQLPFLKSHEVFYPLRNIPPEYYNELAIFPSIGIIMLYCGYYLFFTSSFKKTLTSTSIKLALPQLRKLIIIGGTANIIYNISLILAPQLITALGNTIQILTYSANLTVSIFVIYYLRGGRQKGVIFFVFIISSFELMNMLNTTLFTYMLRFAIGPFLAYFYEKRKIPIITFTLVLFLIYPIYATRTQFRSKANTEASINGKLINGINMLSNIYTKWSFSDKEDKTYEVKDIDRFENVSYLGQCVYVHEIKGKEFYNGETFWWLPLAPIPRILMPWKPVNLLDTKLAFQYGVKQIDDNNSAFNFPMLVESYINFGFLGIIFFSLFQGILFKLFLAKISFGEGDINFLILINLIPWLTLIECNITLVFGGFIQIFVFWWLMLKYFIHSWATPPTSITI